MPKKINTKKRNVNKKIEEVFMAQEWPSVDPFTKDLFGPDFATRGELGTAPAHYSKGKYTPWEVIDDWKLDYYTGNALKYVCRHKHKGKPVEDIQKAIDCLIKYKQNLMEFYAREKQINTIANFMDMDKEIK